MLKPLEGGFNSVVPIRVFRNTRFRVRGRGDLEPLFIPIGTSATATVSTGGVARSNTNTSKKIPICKPGIRCWKS